MGWGPCAFGYQKSPHEDISWLRVPGVISYPVFAVMLEPTLPPLFHLGPEERWKMHDLLASLVAKTGDSVDISFLKSENLHEVAASHYIYCLLEELSPQFLPRFSVTDAFFQNNIMCIHGKGEWGADVAIQWVCPEGSEGLLLYAFERGRYLLGLNILSTVPSNVIQHVSYPQFDGDRMNERLKNIIGQSLMLNRLVSGDTWFYKSDALGVEFSIMDGMRQQVRSCARVDICLITKALDFVTRDAYETFGNLEIIPLPILICLSAHVLARAFERLSGWRVTKKSDYWYSAQYGQHSFDWRASPASHFGMLTAGMYSVLKGIPPSMMVFLAWQSLLLPQEKDEFFQQHLHIPYLSKQSVLNMLERSVLEETKDQEEGASRLVLRAILQDVRRLVLALHTDPEDRFAAGLQNVLKRRVSTTHVGGGNTLSIQHISG